MMFLINRYTTEPVSWPAGDRSAVVGSTSITNTTEAKAGSTQIQT